jgi:hypothetical protein
MILLSNSTFPNDLDVLLDLGINIMLIRLGSEVLFIRLSTLLRLSTNELRKINILSKLILLHITISGKGGIIPIKTKPLNNPIILLLLLHHGKLLPQSTGKLLYELLLLNVLVLLRFTLLL